jgi:hypothetical protein
MAQFDDDYVIQGWPNNNKDAHVIRQRVTATPLGEFQVALDTRAYSTAFVGDDNVEAGSTTTVINATAHVARKGDQLLFLTAGSFQGRIFTVDSVGVNTITVSQQAHAAFITADQFRILRPAIPVQTLFGGSFIDMNWDFSSQSNLSVITREDNPSSASEALLKMGVLREDTLTNGTSANADWHQLKASQLGALYTTSVPDSNGVNGYTNYRAISAGTTNATAVRGQACCLYALECYNSNAAVRYIKLYNKATTPTVGTDTPFKTLGIPPNGNLIISYSNGHSFVNGLGFALTTGIADSDTGAVGINDIAVNIMYK